MTAELVLEPYEYRDPGEVVRAVVSRRPMKPGDVAFALVRAPSTEQRVLRDVRAVEPDCPGIDEAWESVVRDGVRRLRVPRWRGAPRHSIMTIVARTGFAVFGAAEGRWMYAWRYNHDFVDAYKGELIVLTPHGWADFMTGLGGTEPRIGQPSTATMPAALR